MEKNGRPIPPPHLIKQQIIKDYQSKSKYKILVESGTYYGYMIYAQKDNFKKIYSIELSEQLYKLAANRFKKYNHINILEGDSGKVLKNILAEINEPIIFWLDGHYSAGVTAKGDRNCPILEEIDAIFSGPILPHILLIDDARCFIGENDYPTIEQLSSYIANKNVKFKFSVEDDIIRYEIE